ncbi:MAG: hypothetical protein NC122_06970 [Faecalibacterium sp.]|nr:hypothetical protein [Ruminococcus sp.]MCM1391186.1 hypothetical protein [Ruminococcus sp.]MCM1485932.1 hypothetical protein [Faecalibacterium sp.]
MSNFHEQTLRCIKFEITKEEAIEKLCSTFASKKTPEDIFEKTILLRCDRMYLPQYIFIVDYNYMCEAGIYLLNDEGKRIGDTVYQTICGTSGYSFCKRATDDSLAFIPDNFFPDYRYCLDNNSQEIELDLIDILVCSKNSLSWEDVFNSNAVKNYVGEEMKDGVYKNVNKEISKKIGNDRFRFFLTKEHSSDMSKEFDYEITEFSIASMLIPVYQISFKYAEETYTLYVNGCNVKKGWLSNNEVYSASLPVDTTKVKGIFSKISANKAKKLHKEETMQLAKDRWIEQIREEV